MKKFDYILAGGGCAGLSLVYHLLDSSLKDSNILILEPTLGEIPNKTWCYWNTAALPIHPEAARFSWNSFYLQQGKQQHQHRLTKLAYYHLNSHDFYTHVLEKIKNFPNVHFLKEEVSSIHSTGNEVYVETKSSGTYSSSYVFDSRIFVGNETQPILNQVFIGLRIKSNTPVFDPNSMGLMDFDTPGSSGFDFIYTLPFSDQEALIEYTAYTSDAYREEVLLGSLKNFLQQKYGTLAYQITFQESGQIPMTTRVQPTSSGSRHVRIGTAAGWTKPSTGYTFAQIQENCNQLVACLEQGATQNLRFQRKPRFIFYDNILLSIAHHWPKRLPGLFINLFSTSSPDLVFRFLAEKTSFWEEVKLLSRLKFGIFLKGLTRYGTY
ncbi:MAG: lycopene cyclase family protein [Algoriphagus sp.]|nr:lycopene cyclase family protein [Algoriphagus sp.]